jgi:hypothetical protein
MRRHISYIAALALVICGSVVFANSASAAPSKHPTGALHSPEVVVSAHRVKLPASRTSQVGTPPSAVSLSPWTVPVGDQGAVGSCVSWAISYAMNGWYSRFQNVSAGGILFAPMYSYSQTHVSNSPDGGGTYPSSVYGIGSDQGVDVQSHYTQGNYDFVDLPTSAERLNAANYKTGGFSYLFSGAPAGSAAIDAIKFSIANYQPVAITIPVYSAFDNLSATNSHLDASQVDPNTYRGSHEVMIVGYDATGVRIQNSWGTYWGDLGFAYLNWNFITTYTDEATAMTGLLSKTAPSAPTSVTATASGTTATLKWASPVSNGGSPITGYKVARDGTDSKGVGPWSTTDPATATSQTFTSLKPGTTYHLTVQAINAIGAGPTATATILMP